VVGPRYNASKDELTLITERYKSRQMNKDFLDNQLEQIVKESKALSQSC
jgi:hypothetical protein